MPWFRFTEEPRVTLRFRDSVVELNFANLGGENGWAWAAEKKQPLTQVILVRCANMAGLSAALRTTGFAVEGGSAAEKIMLAAVKQRRAEELPEDERWRREILLSRNLETRAFETRSVYTFNRDPPAGRLTLERILGRGLCARNGSPVARLLDQLVREGYATKRPASPRDLR